MNIDRRTFFRRTVLPLLIAPSIAALATTNTRRRRIINPAWETATHHVVFLAAQDPESQAILASLDNFPIRVTFSDVGIPKLIKKYEQH